MKVIVMCEVTGVVRDAFLAKGHDAYSCDILPSKVPGPHLQGDGREFLYKGWDLMIAHPPCTYLASSGMHWAKKQPDRLAKTEAALAFVRVLWTAPIEKIALENPVGCISTRIRKQDQIIQPYQFGDNASKSTCLWLKNLPLLVPTDLVAPDRYVEGLPRWANQTENGANMLGPSADRAALRSATYPGVARAMAEQWG